MVEASPLIAVRTRASTAHVTVLRLVHASSETGLTCRADDTAEASPLIAARTRASTAHVTVLQLVHASGET